MIKMKPKWTAIAEENRNAATLIFCIYIRDRTAHEVIGWDVCPAWTYWVALHLTQRYAKRFATGLYFWSLVIET